MNRVFDVVGRFGTRTRAEVMPGISATRRSISAPAASSPITPTRMAWPPRVAMFSATLAAPPSVQRLSPAAAPGWALPATVAARSRKRNGPG